MLVQKGQLTQCTQQILVVGTVTFSTKRSTPKQWMQQVLVLKGQFTQCTQQIWVVGTITFSANRSTHAVHPVGVGTQRSIHTVYSANMGGGDHLSGLNYIDSLDESKSRCGCPTRAKFHIFQVRQPDRSTNRTPPSIQACAVNWKHQYKYIVN